jgi:hypothetical protein
MKKEKDKTTEQLIQKTDIEYINGLIAKSEDLKDFAISKSTLANISGWALNGETDAEIRKHLDLNKHQWSILCSVCPTLILIMDRSRAMADLVVAGSLFQTAIGGKRIKKQVPVKYKVYDENGKVEREDYKIVEVEEELPPNPMLLKFLAENKLSENFSERKTDNTDRMKELVDSLSPQDKALIEMARKKSEEINGEN